jgi:signal transduction histidine kinase
MDERINVLLVEDNPGDKHLIQHMLLNVSGRTPAPYMLVWHDTLAASLRWVAENPVDVVLLDLSLPDSQGLETVQRMQAAAPALALIVMTGLDSEVLALQSLHAGIQDYLVKGAVNSSLLHRAIRYAIERKQLSEALRQMNTSLEERVRDRTQQLERAVAELERASRLKDEFLSAVSHEMRTPLTGVLGMAEALEMQLAGPLNERQLHYVGTIRTSGSRLLAMVNSILRYAGLISGKVELTFELCRVEDLCAGLLRTFRPLAAKKEQSLTLSIAPPHLEIVSSRDGLSQILSNLLDNAVKFTPPGGQIGLAVNGEGADDTVQFVVWDTGIGIDAEQHRNIFQPFMQGDGSLARRYEGMGLGLAYAQRMADRLGGAVTVASAPGQGSRFTVTLPKTPANGAI